MNIVIYGGGTISHIRSHLALCAPAWGNTARYLKQQLPFADLRLTRMASDTSDLVTNDDVKADLDKYLDDPNTGIIIMNAALCDFEGEIDDVPSGSHAQRLESRNGNITMKLSPKDKLIPYIKERRPDIVIVGFKTTTNASKEEMISKSERMDGNVVLANDTVTRNNIILANKGSLIPEKTEMGGSREKLLNAICNYCLAIQGSVRRETSTELYVDLKPCGYLPKVVAFEKAVEYSERKQEDFLCLNSSWSDKEEGVFILRKSY